MKDLVKLTKAELLDRYPVLADEFGVDLKKVKKADLVARAEAVEGLVVDDEKGYDGVSKASVDVGDDFLSGQISSNNARGRARLEALKKAGGIKPGKVRYSDLPKADDNAFEGDNVVYKEGGDE